MPGLDLGFLDRIIDVQWGHGLPVEFDNKGHVLWRGTPINMSKGTISMWFRVPQETIDNFDPVPAEGQLSILQNMIPILAFTGQPYGPWTEMTYPVINTFYKATEPLPPYGLKPFPYYGSIPGPTWQLPYWPCVIGLYVDTDGVGHLAVALQTRDVGVPQNTTYGVSGADGVADENGMLFGPTELTWINASVVDAKMEWFDPNGTGPEVKPDEWHHVLLSWNLQGSNSAHGNAYDPEGPTPTTPLNEFFDSKSTMYCAFDDENLTKNDLPSSYWVDGFGDNEIACYSCFNLAGVTYFTTQRDPALSQPYYGFPTYTVNFAQGIKMDVVAVPSEPKYQNWTGMATAATEEVAPLQKIEVAELQIFSDLLLDTADVSKRRAFIDFVGEGQEMEPVDPKNTEDILGRRPDILLHTTANWQSGKNTGKIGLARDPDNIIEAGQFQPTETIRKWTPDPRLTKSGGDGV